MRFWQALPPWRRNLYVLVVVQLLTTAGFSLVFPFLPLYVKEIGIATRGSVEFWAGLVFASQAFTMMIASPIWGSLADRYGRKLMVVRATIGGAILLGLMGSVQNVEQLVLLRTIQGLVTGVVSATNALVASSAPRERSGEAMGMLQMARWTGIAAGPVIGGVIGDAVGFRESFWITGLLLGLAGIAVIFWVREDFMPVSKASRPSIFASYRGLLQAPGMAGLYSLNFLRSMGQMMVFPILSLFIVSLRGTDAGAASITGVMIGLTAIASAASAVWLGRLGDRTGHNRVLVIAAASAFLLYLPQPFVTSAWQLLLLQGLSGLAIGGMMPALAALLNLWAPSGNQGATYGLDNSVMAAGRSIAPMLGAAVAVWFGLRGVFGATALVYLMVAVMAVIVVRRSEIQQPTRVHANLRRATGD